MAVGKNPKLGKKKGSKKKVADPFTRKDWYDVKAPSGFTNRQVCKTMVNRTAGTKIASEGLKGRVFEVSLADLMGDEDQSYRKIKLQVEEVHGKNCLTNFNGMDFTRDRLCALIKKWQSLIEARVDVNTTDGYKLRMFCIGFTKRRSNQTRRTSYAQSAQIRAIRKQMVDIMAREASKCDLKELVQKFIPETIAKDIEKACQGIYPLKDVHIRKVKVLKKPKFDLAQLMELHEGGSSSSGVARDDEVADVTPMAGEGGRL
eukprot:g3568.t1